MSLPNVAFEGTLTHDPELRWTKSGVATVTLRVAVNDRKQDDNGNWVNTDTVYFNVVVWRKTAENAAESLRKGDLVVVNGRFKTSQWEDKNGKERTSLDVDALSVGLSLRKTAIEPMEGSPSKLDTGDVGWGNSERVPF